MKKSLKVMMLVHPRLRPDRLGAAGETEKDVWRALKALGFHVEVLALRNDLKAFDQALSHAQPDVVFNLLEEFADEAVFDFVPISYLEARAIPFTGCGARGLMVSRNKRWATHIARGLSIRVPDFYEHEDEIRFPAFVKFVREHASLGLTGKNRVLSRKDMKAVSRKMRNKFPGQLMMQEFIPGLDVTVSILGNDDLRAMTPWCLHLPHEASFATERIKFSAKVRQRQGIRALRYRGPGIEEMKSSALRLYAEMELAGYARMDFRVQKDGTSYFIDVNANPNLAQAEDFARSARHGGLEYKALIQEILKLAMEYKPRV